MTGASIPAGATESTALVGGNILNLNVGKLAEADVAKHGAGIGIDLNEVDLDVRLFGDEVHTSLSLFLLELEGDTADGTTLDTPHQVGNETGNLVAEALGGNRSDFVADLLVGLEVESKASIVLLDDSSGGPLDSLGSDATLLKNRKKKRTRRDVEKTAAE